jgi:hypothetical protein
VDIRGLLAIPVVPRIIVVVPVVVIPRVVVPTVVPRRTPRIVPGPRIIPRIVPTVVAEAVEAARVVPRIIPRVIPIRVVVLVVEAVAIHKHNGYRCIGIIPSGIVVIAVITKASHGAIEAAKAVAVLIIIKNILIFVVATATVGIVAAALYRFIAEILNYWCSIFGFILTAIINVVVVIVRLCLKAKAKATERKD